MAAFTWEMKKIWRPGVVLLLAVLFAVYFGLFASFYVRSFSKSSELHARLVETYGPTLESGERAELDGWLALEMERFSAEVAQVPGAAEAGVTDYASYEEKNTVIGVPLWCAVRDNTNQQTVGALQALMERYDTAGEMREGAYRHYIDSNAYYTDAMRSRADETLDSSRPFSLCSPHAIANLQDYAKYMSAWCVLSVIMLLSPTLVRERLCGTRQLQYTSQRGRGAARMQFASGVVSALALTLVNIILYAVIFNSGQHVWALRECPLPGPIEYAGDFWYDWSLGQYTLALAALIAAFSLAAGAMTLFLSRHSANYVSMLFKAVPVFFVLGVWAAPRVVSRAFAFRGFDASGGIVYLPRGFEFAAAAALLALGAALCALSLGRTGKEELA